MNNSSSKSTTKSIVTKSVEAVKSVFTEPKRYVNPSDGTIAESLNTYREFRADIIKSYGYGC